MTQQTPDRGAQAAGCLGQGILSILKLILVMIGLLVAVWIIAIVLARSACSDMADHEIRKHLRYAERKMREALKAAQAIDFSTLDPMEEWEIRAAQAPPNAIIPELEFIDDEDLRVWRIVAASSVYRLRAVIDELDEALRR
jgi:hypothetical protein